ncbi:hypothetical protein G7009_18170 [Pseudomonas capeferrum]|jgi:hypothetical protein|uniref:hypothetical protein n=2 Tax=cellular organisms TaxID=131567 RepID=UPI0015E40875|nr:MULTISPECIES: hypothetical protein [Pseudomonas]MBA1203651.1 hypothetical protein [Pseudomonas capeferrum]
MSERKVSFLAFFLATISYVAGMHIAMSLLGDDNILMGTTGNLIAAVVTLYLERIQARWIASVVYMLPAILLPLFVSSALKGMYEDKVFVLLCAIIISGFMLPVARLIIPIFATLAQRKIIAK